MFKNIPINGDEPSIEDITREFNRGTWTIGYTGISPERLKLHMANQHTFDKTTLRANGGSEIQDGYPEVTMAMVQKLGWDKDLTPEELAVITKIGGEKIGEVNWKTDLSGGLQRVVIKHGIAPFGNAKARAVAWNLPDP